MMGRRREFLTAKHVLSNQAFRDLYKADTLSVDQRFKIGSLTVLFTDLRGSTELYERVGDLAAYDLVRHHFRALATVVREHDGAVIYEIAPSTT
jgi:class 3 adenylate cyclase